MTANPAVHAADESPELAKIFLKEHPDVWHSWVSKDAGKKVVARLRANLLQELACPRRRCVKHEFVV
jgi:hypothetical protein